MKQNDLHRIIVWLSQILSCPICDQRYSLDHTRVLNSKRVVKNEEQSLVVHSDCQNCRSSMVFSISLLGNDIFSVGMISDLNAADALKLRSAAAISSDELINFHFFLQTFNGDFRKVLTADS